MSTDPTAIPQMLPNRPRTAPNADEIDKLIGGLIKDREQYVQQQATEPHPTTTVAAADVHMFERPSPAPQPAPVEPALTLWAIRTTGVESQQACASQALATRNAALINLILQTQARADLDTGSTSMVCTPQPWAGAPEVHAAQLADMDASDPTWSDPTIDVIADYARHQYAGYDSQGNPPADPDGQSWRELVAQLSDKIPTAWNTGPDATLRPADITSWVMDLAGGTEDMAALSPNDRESLLPVLRTVDALLADKGWTSARYARKALNAARWGGEAPRASDSTAPMESAGVDETLKQMAGPQLVYVTGPNTAGDRTVVHLSADLPDDGELDSSPTPGVRLSDVQWGIFLGIWDVVSHRLNETGLIREKVAKDRQKARLADLADRHDGVIR